MSKPEILVVGQRPDWYVESLRADFIVHHIPDDDPDHLDRKILERLTALTSGSFVGKRLLEAMPALEIIAYGSAGYEKIDLVTMRDRGVILTNTPGVTDKCVADMAFALLLDAARRVSAADRLVRATGWSEPPLAHRVSGRPVGILGLGRIGRTIARRASGFDMPIFYHNRREVEDVDYTYCADVLSLAEAADFLVVACPGGPGTHHLVDKKVLDALGARGIVVNIARGSIIDEAALVDALSTGTIMAAGLDVFEHEPKIPQALLKSDHVVLTPHFAGGTFETWGDACDLVKANLWAHFKGTPLVTPVP